MGLKLDEVVPWGRSFDEYAAMFALSAADLGRRIVCCADGPAAFNAGMAARGHFVVSTDPLYAFRAEAIRQRIRETSDMLMREVRKHLDTYVWTTIRSVEELGRRRMAAMEAFLADLAAGAREGRYVAAALPRLPFGGGAFDLALCSHFLFTYSRHLSAAFHLDAIREMARVAAEVRVFPILDAGGERSPHIAPLIAALREERLAVELRKVPYEFQVGGDEMMIARRAK